MKPLLFIAASREKRWSCPQLSRTTGVRPRSARPRRRRVLLRSWWLSSMNSRHLASIFEIIARNDSRSCASRSAAIRPSTFEERPFFSSSASSSERPYTTPVRSCMRV